MITRRRWSDTEIALLKKLYPDTHKTLDDIEIRLGRTKHAIHGRVTKLGLTAPYSRHFRRLYSDGRIDDLSEVECAYIAGLFDGEGSLINNKGYFRIQIVNTNLEVLEWIKPARGIGKNKSVFLWLTNRAEMVDKLLRCISPYLIIKREITKDFLEHRDNLTAGGRRRLK